ncbi:glycosyltransferase family 2 protein [Leptolyngbya cf. ectocarpi LEGE 11479]|uniref:Glycosyltransferase family 2 protein n=1 Tax=Leptolyngbya cf. ectocarpi LEGE 11479 TaxID=1828722 RepID=A0A928ZW54_LEPEC|nr:glycosyltransferase family A protein [Leptolyngbya ectocarpi]MBE9068560.1 glycosyltransferase family 2 protein [Leptolyngbya cf. ectocarpi LEGE 11479]
MQQKPLVSCITIFLNAEKFIEEAIASIFAQTYTDWEFILVDDGSTDRSTAIAVKYADTYPNHVICLEHNNHQNKGMSASRNLGIKAANGKYICFLDADDVWLPQKLEQQVALLEDRPDVAMVYGLIHFWYSWTGKLEDKEQDFIYRRHFHQASRLFTPPQLLILLLRERAPAVGLGCNPMIRKEVFSKVGYFEAAFRDHYEDYVLLSKVTLDYSVLVTDQCWSKYRRHPDSCTAISFDFVENIDKICSAKLKFLTWLSQYLIQKEIKNIWIWLPIKIEGWWHRYPRLLILKRQLQNWLSR